VNIAAPLAALVVKKAVKPEPVFYHKELQAGAKGAKDM
jgi:hypothetical protein